MICQIEQVLLDRLLDELLEAGDFDSFLANSSLISGTIKFLGLLSALHTVLGSMREHWF